MSEYPKEYEKTLILDDGTAVLFRPELSTDTEMLWQMFSTLSQDSLRFLVLPFSRDRIERWTSNINYDKALPILAVVKQARKTRIVAAASLEFFEPPAFKHKAEFGITVHDDFQNKGIGTALTKHMLDIAKKKRLHRVFLKVITENKRALQMYEKMWVQNRGKTRKRELRQRRILPRLHNVDFPMKTTLPTALSQNS